MKHFTRKALFGALFALMVFPLSGLSQLTVDDTPTATDLAQLLAGPGITVTGATLTGASLASGSFDGSASSLGMASGVILSTGDVNNAPGPNDDAGGFYDDLGQPGDPVMDSIAGGVATFDAVELRFDFEVQSSYIEFEYIFASEEYPEYAPPNSSAFNDVFSFFISGPGITGEENIALVPGTSNPVSINNINAVTNNHLYVDNTGGTTVQYDAWTTTLKAQRDFLIPCQTYTLRLVIADAGDEVWNSAVFLKENSFIQGTVDVSTQTVNADSIALEGCIPASFTFSLLDPSSTDTDITYTIGGTATNGVDYQFIDTLVTIPAGQTEASIIINSISDGITEGQESIYIIYQSTPCSPLDTAFLFIDDAQPIEFDLNGTDLLCHSDSTGVINVNATGGFPPYTYEVTDSNGTVIDYTSVPITGQAAGEYSVQVYDTYGCKAEALVVGGAFDAGTTFLPDGSGVTYTSDIIISGFDPGATLDTMSQLQHICANLEHSYLGDLEIRIIAPTGESVILKQYPGGGSCDLGEPIATAPVDGAASSTLTDPGTGYDYCWNDTPSWGTMVAESNTWTRNYTDAQGHNYTDNYLIAGSYTSFEPLNQLLGAELNGTWTMEVTDNLNLDNGYIFEWNISLLSDLPDTLVVIEEPEGMDISGFITQANCGGSDGAINIDVIGDHGPFTYLWSTGATTQDISGIPSGTYTVWVTDTTSCTDSMTFNLNNISSINITSSVSNATCAGGSDGAIDVTISGGTPPYSISWSHGPTSEDVTGLPAGLYTISVTDANSCLFSEDITVGEMPAVTVNLVSSQNEICGTNNGSIDISVSGGTGSYGYSWSNGATTQDINGLQVGTYNVTVTDGNGCVGTGSFSILNDVSSCSGFCYLDITNINVTSDTCGSGVGAIDITVTDPSLPYNVSWDSGETTDDISGTTYGSYTVTVNDANGCTDSETIVIPNYTGTLDVTSVSTNDEICGGANGTINITVSGGSLPYAFNWSNGATTEDITGLTAGTYSVDITDGAGCMMTETISISNNTGTLNETAVVADDTCGASVGAIDLTVTGGNAPISYSWDSGQTTQDISNVPAGAYTCTITDASGCVLVSAAYSVGNSSGTLSLDNVSITNEECSNTSGAIDLTVSGGTAPITFNWDSGATTEDISGLSAGNFECTISDANGCNTSTGTLTIFNSPSSLAVSTNFVTDEICGNSQGAINIDVSGGTAPYSFSWTGGSTSEDLLNVSAGTYTVTVTDANGCSTAHAEVVNNVPGTLVIDNAILADENCGDATGSIDLVVSGGTAPLSYLWSNGSTTEDLTGLSAGTYTVDITDANGCSVSASYSINNNASTLTVTPTITAEICSNGSGSITLSVSGGATPYTYLWNTGATTQDLTGLSAGTYSCVITDNAGCSVSTGSLNVVNNAGSLAVTGTVTDDVCATSVGGIDITVTGASGSPSFSWSTGATTEDLTGQLAGNYSVTVTDAAGCTVNYSGTINDTPGTLSLDNVSVTNELCDDNQGAIDLTVSGGTPTITYSWSSGPTTEDISGLDQGTYSCTITDASGCSVSTGNITVSNDPGTMSLDNVMVTDEQCGNGLGAINVTISGGMAPYSYLWNTGAITEDLTAIPSGIYTCTITDQNGCTLDVNATVGNNAGAMTVAGVVTDESCGAGDGAIDITVSNGSTPITYSWSNSATTEDITGLSAGTYTVQVVDNNGCSVTHSEIVDDLGSGLAISASSVADEICSNGAGQINLTVSGGAAPYSYVWSNGATTEDISGLSSGVYSITITDANGCTTSGSYTINNDPGTLSLDGAVVTDEACGNAGGSIDIEISGGSMPISYSWSNGATTQDVSGLSAGAYSVSVTDNFGCTVSTTENIVNVTGGFTASITSVTDENCGDAAGAIDLTVSGGTMPYTYSWSNSATTEDLSGLSAGSYSVVVTDDVGCSTTLDTVVNNNTTGLTLVSSLEQNESCGDSTGYIDLVISGGATPYTFNWSNGATTEDISGLTSGTYTCTITDAGGCVLNYSGTIGSNGGNFAVSEVIVDELCDDDGGSVTVTVSGGISPYTFTWTGGGAVNCCDYTLEMFDTFGDGWNGASIDVEINGVNAGNFTVNAGNSETSTFQVCNGDNVELFWNSGTWDTEVSFDLLDPSGTTIFSHGASPAVGSLYTFTGACASGSANSSMISGLTAGTYDLTITDDVGCSYSDSYVVDSAWNTSLAFSTVNVNDANCGVGGDLSVTATGGTFYTYYLDGVSTTFPNWTGIGPGTFNVVIEDENGCTVEQDITIDDILPFNISAVFVTNESCGLSDGAVDIEITPAGSYNYSWNTGATTEDISGVMAGNYSVTVDDGAGCSTTLDTTVLSDPGFTLSAVVTNENCGDGTGAIDITASVSDTYSYNWSNGATTEDVSMLSAGSYSVDVTNSSGCSVTLDTTVTNITTGIAVAGDIVTNENCGDSTGSIDITVSGGSLPYSYAWSNGATTQDISGLTSGTYTCIVADASGCEITYSGTVSSDDNFVLSSVQTDEMCNDDGGSVTVDVSGGTAPYTFSWTGATGLSCCDYALDMFDASTSWNGATVEVFIDGSSIGTFTVFGGGANYETFNVCDGQNVELVWSPGAFDNEVSFNLLDPSGAVIFAQGPNPPTGTLYTYTASCPATSSTTITDLSAGTYDLTVTDASGCTRTETYVIDSLYNTSLGFSSINTIDDYCGLNNGSIDVNAIGGTTYDYYLDGVLQPGNPIVGLVAGNYVVMVEDENGCTVESMVSIANVLPYNPVFVSVTDENCGSSDGTIDLDVTPSGSYTFNWSNGATTEDITGLVAGNYSVTIDDGTGCTTTLDTTITNNVTFTLAAASTADFCTTGNGTVDLTVTGGTGPFGYDWDNGATTEDLSGLNSGSYFVTVIDSSDGCSDTLTVLVTDSVGFTVSEAIASDSCGMGNGAVDLTISGGTGPFTYAWSNGATTEDISSLGFGNYDVTVTDVGSGCVQSFSYVVPSTASFGLIGTVTDATCPTCADGSIDIGLSGSPTGPFDINWSNGETTFDITNLLPGWYTITVIDDLGCMVVDSFEVSSPTLVIENEDWNVNIYPNPTFGEFNVLYQIAGANDVRFQVFDLVGQLIEAKQMSGSEGAVRFDLGDHRSGTYYLRMTSGEVSKTFKLMLVK